MMYNALTPELMAGRSVPRAPAHPQIQQPLPRRRHTRVARRRPLSHATTNLGRVGKGVFMEPPLQVDYGCNVALGEGFYSNFGLVILDCGIVKTGDHVMMEGGPAYRFSPRRVGVCDRGQDWA
ncbi:hypothetical protein B0H67DRAFT_660443 [Lasiosphaeris hirsuta]|uniref:Uncharacterized protein n=1 Tax=Lasiosphaeris hirsuta TaxID=260670 RepID=A0AA40ANJ5_9PEZI|nr:hypothetical protein B0H67DRAFT_660443 [Lasiosphaeris hirsuta]